MIKPIKEQKQLRRLTNKNRLHAHIVGPIKKECNTETVGVAAGRNKHGRYGHFYNPAYSIARSISDSLNPEKVHKHGPVKETRSQPYCGIKVVIIRVIKESEKAKSFLLPNGHILWVPKKLIDEEGVGYIRVPTYFVRKAAYKSKLPSKFGQAKILNREVIKHYINRKRQ